MYSLAYRQFDTGPPPDRKPVWILLTALAFAVIGLILAYGIIPPTEVVPLSVAFDVLAPSSIRLQYW